MVSLIENFFFIVIESFGNIKCRSTYDCECGLGENGAKQSFSGIWYELARTLNKFHIQYWSMIHELLPVDVGVHQAELGEEPGVGVQELQDRVVQDHAPQHPGDGVRVAPGGGCEEAGVGGEELLRGGARPGGGESVGGRRRAVVCPRFRLIFIFVPTSNFEQTVFRTHQCRDFYEFVFFNFDVSSFPLSENSIRKHK